ncbi:unnamed protein product, partial [Iphiclides podalirius]
MDFCNGSSEIRITFVDDDEDLECAAEVVILVQHRSQEASETTSPHFKSKPRKQTPHSRVETEESSRKSSPRQALLNTGQN